MKKRKLIRLQDIVIAGIAVSSSLLFFCASGVSASSVIDEFSVEVPESCSLSSTVDTEHNTNIKVGQYRDDIGETSFNVFCNDSEGFSVYAIGYSENKHGNTKMVPTNNLAENAIATGLATSGETSNWAMKLTAVSDNFSITNDFESYHLVPNNFVKVATYPSNTESAAGVQIKSTYATYISSTQPADTYTGKVKYTVVHPSDAEEPVLSAMLDTGSNVNVKMKNLASNISNATYQTNDSKIKAVQRSNTLPNDFTATANNTISLDTSSVPIYIFFDDTNDAGIMYYYAENNADVVANSDSSNMFSYMYSLTDIAGVSNWDTAKVTDMSNLFRETKITSLDALAPNKNNNPNIWNTGNVTNMKSMFFDCTSLTDITGLSNWDTAKVTNMSYMFYYIKITSLDALIPNKNNNPNIWNTGNVTNMSCMFRECSSLTDITGLSNWDTANVTDMSYMFYNTKITSLDALIPNKNNNPNIWNTGNVTNMKSMFYSCSSLIDITGIAGWDVSKVTATASSTSSSTNKFSYMFFGVPSATTSGFSFTNRAGSLNSDGTYVTSS